MSVISKETYVTRNFQKISGKRWELYVITRVIHLLDDPDIEYVCQQYINPPQNKEYYLADLAFPSLKLYLEIDEDQHGGENHKIADIKRDAEILEATDWECKRIAVFVNNHGIKTDKKLTDLNREIDDFVQFVKNRKQHLIEQGNTIAWDYEKKFLPKSFIEKRDYLILNFTNCSNGSSIDLSYHLDWNFDDLNKFIKKNPFYNKRTENVLEEDVEYGGLLSNLKRAIQNAKKYYKSIDSSLLLPWGLEKNNFKFNSSIDDEKIMFDNEEEYLKQAREDIEAELLSEGEDRAAELQLDMIRGK